MFVYVKLLEIKKHEQNCYQAMQPHVYSELNALYANEALNKVS